MVLTHVMTLQELGRRSAKVRYLPAFCSSRCLSSLLCHQSDPLSCVLVLSGRALLLRCCKSSLSLLLMQHDITALGLLTCRHGFVLKAMNAFTGERHVYALCFVAWLASRRLTVSYLW